MSPLFEAISEEACGYLTEWVQAIRPRIPRPAHYSFLNHSTFSQLSAHEQPAVVQSPFRRAEPRPVWVLQSDGHDIAPVTDILCSNISHFSCCFLLARRDLELIATLMFYSFLESCSCFLRTSLRPMRMNLKAIERQWF